MGVASQRFLMLLPGFMPKQCNKHSLDLHTEETQRVLSSTVVSSSMHPNRQLVVISMSNQQLK